MVHQVTRQGMYDALNIDFNCEHRLGISRPQGPLNEYFCRQLLNFLLALEEVAEPFDRVLDLTLVTGVPLDNAAIREYANARRHATANLPRFRTAIIAPSPEAEALARLYATLMHDSRIEVVLFPNAISAARWLGVPENAISNPVIKTF
jgi:hypothetical protein